MLSESESRGRSWGDAPRSHWRWFIPLCLFLGAALRFGWGTDIEFKFDEAYMFDAAAAGTLPALGMPSGVGIRNPGLSVWAFVGLFRLFHAHEPPDLALAVEAVNVAALALLFAFARRWAPPEDRTVWLWAAALACVNPFGVLFSRKIWAQCLLPPMSMALLACWWRRDGRLFALGWGLLGALIGQIHMSGFFLAAGYVTWTLLFRRRPCRWAYWLAGTGLGALPLWPWIAYVAKDYGSALQASNARLYELEFYRHWFESALGVSLDYSLGPHFPTFARGPTLAGHSSFLAGSASVALYALFAAMLPGMARRAWSRRKAGARALACTLAATPTRQALGCVFVGMGLLATLSGVVFQMHYLIAVFPLHFVLVAVMARGAWRRWPKVLGLMWAAQLVVSSCFLLFVHASCGAPAGDFGLSYRCAKAVYDEHQTKASLEP